MRCLTSACITILLTATAASPADPVGVLAASCGDQVVLIEAAGGRTAAIDTGPVGWLYPAPGAVVFAPDLIHGRTTVISTAPPTVVERLAGVTMPLFGSMNDRYVVAGPGRVLTAAYPGRGIISRREVDIGAPWRTLLEREGRFLFVVERDTDGGGVLTAVSAIDGSIGARTPLEQPVTDAVLVPEPPTIALADRTGGVIGLRPAATLTPVLFLDAEGEVAGIAIAREQWLAAAVRSADGGRLRLWKLLEGGDGIRVKRKGSVELPGPPLDVAVSPDGGWLGVVIDGPEVVILRWRDDEVVTRAPLPTTPRDLVWTDPTRPGPLWPEWSDGR